MTRRLDQRIKAHHLRALEAIGAQRSLLKAATVLGLSQPALSRTLQELEEIVGTRLFDRLPRGVQATEAGLLLVQAARRMLAELRRLEDELDRVASPAAGTVAVGALPVAASGVLPGTLVRLKADRPLVRVRLEQGRTEELLPLLAAGQVDLIVGRLYAPATPDGFTREPLWDEPISVLARAGHPLFAGPVTREALSGFEPVLPTISQRVGQEIEALAALLGLAPAVFLRSSSYGFIREMLHATDMISVMPQMMMAGDLQRGTLRVVPLPVAAPSRPAGLILPPAAQGLAPAARAFTDALRRHVCDLAQQGVASISGGYTSG